MRSKGGDELGHSGVGHGREHSVGFILFGGGTRWAVNEPSSHSVALLVHAAVANGGAVAVGCTVTDIAGEMPDFSEVLSFFNLPTTPPNEAGRRVDDDEGTSGYPNVRSV